MILAVHQPYFLPYIGYWQLIHAADLFLVADDYAFIKGGWIKRNRILVNGRPHYLGIGVREDSFKRCDEMAVRNIDETRIRNLLYEGYHKAPHYREGMALIDETLSCGEKVLSEFLLNAIRVVCAYLGIDTPIGRTSDFPGNRDFKREERIYDLCARLDADIYANAIGGTSLYDFEAFRRRGVELRFLKPSDIVYRQYQNDFVRDLSIIDAIMFNARDAVRAMLDRYTWVTEAICITPPPPAGSAQPARGT